MIERRGDLAVAELGPRRHGAGVGIAVDGDRAFEPEQHHAHQIVAAVFLREHFCDVAGERRKCTGNSLPVLLMTQAATGAEGARAELLPFEFGLRRRLRSRMPRGGGRKERDGGESKNHRSYKARNALLRAHRWILDFRVFFYRQAGDDSQANRGRRYSAAVRAAAP